MRQGEMEDASTDRPQGESGNQQPYDPAKDPKRKAWDAFVSDDWTRSKLSSTEAGKKVTEILLSTNFWNSDQDCICASQPLLIVLRIVDGDEKPAMPEVVAAMNMAKAKITSGFEGKRQWRGSRLSLLIEGGKIKWRWSCMWLHCF
jgi:hypothetical protein